MAKKKIVLYGVAALFAVSGIVALPSGNIAGGVGCIVIAAVCAFLGKKSADKETETGKPAREATRPVSGSRIAETIRTKSRSYVLQRRRRKQTGYFKQNDRGRGNTDRKNRIQWRACRVCKMGR